MTNNLETYNISQCRWFILDNLSASELKKLKNKQRKAQKKAAAAAAQEKAAADEAAKQKDKNSRGGQDKSDHANDSEQANKVDELQPSKLERCEDPLEQAIKFLIPLQALCPDNMQSHILAYEIYSRKSMCIFWRKTIMFCILQKLHCMNCITWSLNILCMFNCRLLYLCSNMKSVISISTIMEKPYEMKCVSMFLCMLCFQISHSSCWRLSKEVLTWNQMIPDSMSA